MRATLATALQMYREYFGASGYAVLFLISCVYLVKRKRIKMKKKEIFLLGYSLIFAFLYLCPITAKIIMKYCIGEGVYWRMFWLLPYEIVIAYVLCLWISDAEKWRKALLVGASFVVILCAGQQIYNSVNFTERSNIYKIDAEAVAACEIIEADAAANGLEKQVISVNDLLEEIRQYDASIAMPYGRNAVRNTGMTRRTRKLYTVMNESTLDAKRLAFYAAGYGYNYLIYYTDQNVTELTDAGYVKIGDAGSHTVYRLDQSYEERWLVTQYGNPEGSQQMFYTIENLDGYLIAVDGGKADNEGTVRSVLSYLGQHVDTWIITHPHDDHAESFCAIYEDPQGLKIDQVYTVDMASPELCMENASWDSVDVYERFLKLDIQNLNYVAVGDTLDFDGLQVDILSAYNDHVDEISNDLLNDGSMMFRITGKTQSMLFCSDVGKSMSDYLLDKYGEQLKSDYLQMGHHGNGGLKKDFYEMVQPKIAFFDAPDWLFNDTTGAFTSLENRRIMEGLGAWIYSFTTAPNSIVLE